MGRLWLDTALRSVAARHHSSNQDSVAGSAQFAFVADGVGGHAGGDVASATVTNALVAALADADVASLAPEQLRELLAAANAAIHRYGDRDPSLAGMATTFTGIFAGDGTVRVVHIGDSRAYRLHGDAGELVTHDDSFVQRLVDAGAIRESEARHHPQRNIILRSLAGDAADAAGITVTELPGQPGDRWVICSDGLSDTLSGAEVVAVARSGATPEAAAAALLSVALAARAHDDVSVAVCDVVADGRAGTHGPDVRAPRRLGAAEARGAGP